jgi:hypothetical protein
MTSKKTANSTAIKHLNAMLVLTGIVPVAWIGYSLTNEKFTMLGTVQSLFYYALMFAMISGMKKGNGKNRKFVGYVNLIGVASFICYLSIDGNQYPVIGITAVVVVWAYVACVCLLSKDLKQFLDANKAKV